MNYKLSTKKMLGGFANTCNLLEIVSRNRPKSIVLGYHRVLPDTSNQLEYCSPGMYVTDDTFKRHIAFLRKHYKLVPLNDLINNSTSDMCCAITFDDGWLDNYLFAWPILREQAVPATIFLTTGFINEQQWPWPDRLMYYKLMSSETEVIGIMNKCGKELEIIFTTPCLSILGMIAEIKRFSHSQISQLMALVDSCLSQLHAELHKTCPALSWENIREMSDFGIEYGLHSHRHIIANDATPVSLIELDYLTAAKIFMAELGKQPTLFAYPNGDYNNDVIQILNRMNINCSVTTEAGYYRDQSPMTIKRILLHNDISSTEDLLNYRLITSVCFNG